MDSICNIYSHREAAAWAPKKKNLPVTLVTGFLGAGKTTLLNYVLTNKHNLKIAAAVNDFAAINIDGQIVRGNKQHDSVVELTNGCLCCTISGEFQTAVWNLLQDADIGKIDYLLVETSGVTDPLATIATLERDYGQMYRIRLDTVVTVVDTDALVSQLEAGGSDVLQSAAADSQLQCADIVLLNKRDLISSAQLDMAHGFIVSRVPGAQVYSCVKCAVPLNHLMEVAEVELGDAFVSHEVTSAAYTISQGGAKNKVRQKRLKESSSGSDPTSHISQDDFSSLCVESSCPFILSKFQSFLGSKFPKGIFRMKGTVWFEENRSCVYSFHMSGRQHYEFVPCSNLPGGLGGAFSVQLVAIGRGIDTELIEMSLRACLVSSEPSPLSEAHLSRLVTQIDSAKDLVRADPRFELLESAQSTDGRLDRYIDFRLLGVIEYGVTVHEAGTVYGINFNRMNDELTLRVNGSTGPHSLLPVLLSTSVQMCRHGIGPDSDFGGAWIVITGVAKKLVDQFYRAVGYCKCGM